AAFWATALGASGSGEPAGSEQACANSGPPQKANTSATARIRITGAVNGFMGNTPRKLWLGHSWIPAEPCLRESHWRNRPRAVLRVLEARGPRRLRGHSPGEERGCA